MGYSKGVGVREPLCFCFRYREVPPKMIFNPFHHTVSNREDPDDLAHEKNSQYILLHSDVESVGQISALQLQNCARR